MKNLLIICLVISLAADSLLLSAAFGLALYVYSKKQLKSDTYEKEI